MTEEIYSMESLVSIITGLLKKDRAERAVLFGSYARYEADVLSDIDLLVIGGAGFEPADVFCMAEDLHRTTGKAVNIYELCEINQDSDFYRTILREGVPIAA